MNMTALVDLSPLRTTLTRPDGTTVLAVPGDPEYKNAQPWNLSKEMNPAAVVLAENAEDVSLTVRFAAEHHLRVAVQGTGHGASDLTSQDTDMLLVHTARMSSVEIDPSTATARIGAGTAWGQVVAAAAEYGLAPITGSAPSVGVVGFLTGGGVGPLVRTYGLASDWVKAFELVTGSGETHRVTATENPDLFWGLRGGKATLGIVTQVEIGLVQLSDFYGGCIYFDGADHDTVGRILHAWRAWSMLLPEQANTSLAIYQLPGLPTVPAQLAGRMTIAIRYTSTAPFEEAADLVAPIRALGNPLIDTFGVAPYSAIGTVHSDPEGPAPSTDESFVLAELPAEAVDRLLQLAGPGSGSVQVMVELRRLGGALSRPPTTPDAFSHRDAPYTFLAVGAPIPGMAEQVKEQAKAMTTAMEPWSSHGIMPNWASDLPAVDRKKCYDDETAERLAELAESYDPAGTFRVGQVIRA